MSPTSPQAFPEVLSQAVANRNLTLERLSARLKSLGTPVSIATLSYWQSGRSLPTRTRSLKALEHLERILEVPPGHLTSALPGDTSARWDPRAVLPRRQKVDIILDEMGLDLNRHVHTLQLQDSFTLSPDLLIQTQTSRHLVRVEDEQLTGVPGVFFQSYGDEGPPGLSAGNGCRLGKLEVVEEDLLVVGELLFPHPLAKADLHLYEYQVLWQYQTVATSAMRSLPGAVEFLVLDATFEGEPPEEACYYYTPSQDTPREQWTRREVVPGRHIQVAMADAPAGQHYLLWRMPGDPPINPEVL